MLDRPRSSRNRKKALVIINRIAQNWEAVGKLKEKSNMFIMAANDILLEPSGKPSGIGYQQ